MTANLYVARKADDDGILLHIITGAPQTFEHQTDVKNYHWDIPLTAIRLPFFSGHHANRDLVVTITDNDGRIIDALPCRADSANNRFTVSSPIVDAIAEQFFSTFAKVGIVDVDGKQYPWFIQAQ